MNLVPPIVEHGQLCKRELIHQFDIVRIEATESNVARRLNDRSRLAIEQHRDIGAIPRSKLLTRHGTKLTILTIANKDAAHDGTDEEATIGAVVDRDGIRMIQYVEITVRTILDNELLARHLTRLSNDEFIVQVMDPKVPLVDL